MQGSIWWFLGLLAAFIVGVVVTKMVSVGSIAAAVLFPFMGLYVYWQNPVAIVLCFAIGILVLWSHRSNMQRLLNGTENKIGSKKTAKNTAKE